jgi:hypothetical protein
MRFSASEIWQWMLARRACSGHGEQNNPTGQSCLPGLPQGTERDAGTGPGGFLDWRKEIGHAAFMNQHMKFY